MSGKHFDSATIKWDTPFGRAVKAGLAKAGSVKWGPLPGVGSDDKPKNKFATATPTVVDGIRFPSKTQANVYRRLKAELLPGERLYCDVRFPLLSSGANERGRPGYLTCDFVIVGPTGAKLIDAKPKKKAGTPRSREWDRGVRALASQPVIVWRVEEVAR